MHVFHLHNFIKKVHFGPPPQSASFLYYSLSFEWKRCFWGARDFTPEVDFCRQVQWKIDFYNKNSNSQKQFHSSLCSRGILFGLILTAQGIEKWSATGQARVTLLLGIWFFFEKLIFHCPWRSESTFGLKSRAPQNRRFHKKTWGVVQKMKVRETRARKAIIHCKNRCFLSSEMRKRCTGQPKCSSSTPRAAIPATCQSE